MSSSVNVLFLATIAGRMVDEWRAGKGSLEDYLESMSPLEAAYVAAVVLAAIAPDAKLATRFLGALARAAS